MLVRACHMTGKQHAVMGQIFYFIHQSAYKQTKIASYDNIVKNTHHCYVFSFSSKVGRAFLLNRTVCVY